MDFMVHSKGSVRATFLSPSLMGRGLWRECPLPSRLHFGALLQLHSSYLYKRETQLSLTNRTMHLCKCNAMVNLLETYPP